MWKFNVEDSLDHPSKIFFYTISFDTHFLISSNTSKYKKILTDHPYKSKIRKNLMFSDHCDKDMILIKNTISSLTLLVMIANSAVQSSTRTPFTMHFCSWTL